MVTNVNFGGPAGGSRTWKGAFAPAEVITTWLVETEILSALEEQYLLEEDQGKSSQKC